MRTVSVVTAICLAGLAAAPSGVTAEEPLHAAIDRLIDGKVGGAKMAPVASDAEFLRRIMLDLAGRIPTAEEVRRFLDDTSPHKRETLCDALLAGDDYPRRMQELFHAMLMERRGENPEWSKFLRSAFAENLPWDQVVRDMLFPDATHEQRRGAAYFLTARLTKEGAMAAVDVPGLTRDVGRLLAGVDLGCAQCHDHVSIDDYKQVDFQGLHMIFENMQSRGGLDYPAVSEKVLTQEKEFKSVFAADVRRTMLRVPGAGDVPIATFPKGEEYLVAPDRKAKTPGVLKFSPLKELANRLANANNRMFARSIANRLWYVMMGRGLVEPLDLFHSDNPASHPELLDLLASEFAAHKFDIKWFLGQLARTRCYQRGSRMPGDAPLPNEKSYRVANQKRLSAEQLFWSTMIATGEFDRVGKGNEKGFEQVVAEHESLVELQKQFIKVFANPPREPEVDFAPTVKAALYLMHDPAVLKLLTPQPGNLVDGLASESDAGKVAQTVFLTILSRRPTAEDIADVERVLRNQAGDARADGIARLAWALLASTEFCVNH